MEPPQVSMTSKFNTSKAIAEWMAYGRDLKEKHKRQANMAEEEIADATSRRDVHLAAISLIEGMLELAMKDYYRLKEAEDAKP